MQRISANQSAGGLDNLSSEVNRIFKDSEPDRSMFSNNSQFNQGIRNSGVGPFYNLKNSGIQLQVNGRNSDIENDSRRNSSHFANPARNSRLSHTSKHSRVSQHSQSSHNIIYRNDSSQ